jgi:hypothetical protein
MFRYYLFLFILLFSTSSMFELLVVVADVVMLNILELIMEIVPNYPTGRAVGGARHRPGHTMKNVSRCPQPL